MPKVWSEGKSVHLWISSFNFYAIVSSLYLRSVTWNKMYVLVVGVPS